MWMSNASKKQSETWITKLISRYSPSQWRITVVIWRASFITICVACGSYSPGMFLNNQSPAARLCYPAPIYITILRLCYSRYVKSTDFTITIRILYYTITIFLRFILILFFDVHFNLSSMFFSRGFMCRTLSDWSERCYEIRNSSFLYFINFSSR
jgi:hypothetical protein